MVQLGGNYLKIFSSVFGITMKLIRLIEMCLNESHSEVCIGKYLSDRFPIQHGVKLGQDLLPSLLNLFQNTPPGRSKKPGRIEIEWDTSASGLY
jgi:hypothetical protein